MIVTNSLQSLKTLTQLIETDEVIQTYQKMTIKVHQNESVRTLYDRYIEKQKEVVKLEHYQKHEAQKQAERELSELESQLLNQPLLNNYLEYQREINELAQDMSHHIQLKINEHLSEN